MVDYIPNIIHLEHIDESHLFTPEKFIAAQLDPPPSINYKGLSQFTEKIPDRFQSLETWPTVSNFKCWLCGFSFTDSPKFVPLSFKKFADESIEIKIQGNFCSFACTAKYIETHYDYDQSRKLKDILLYVYYLFTNKLIEVLKTSPLPTEQIQYGGDILPQLYREMIKKIETENISNGVPMDLRTSITEKQEQKDCMWKIIKDEIDD
uniref:BA71V-B175L homolog protein n=1 Tax=Abalone asfa-like virus TaxID=2839893 RepID=A0A5K7XY35_9VIRU|nr:BA71V-B175L homolog protein [Abalone asfa-like virus]BCY04573.1 hypothetical protein [Abalone asfa-like virus]